MTGHWTWAILGTGVGAGAGIAVRTCAYLLRERTRRRSMTTVLRELGRHGGYVEVNDQDGTVWTVRRHGGEPE